MKRKELNMEHYLMHLLTFNEYGRVKIIGPLFLKRYRISSEHHCKGSWLDSRLREHAAAKTKKPDYARIQIPFRSLITVLI